MRTPRQRRPRKRVTVVPVGVDLEALASRVRYAGSPEHKDSPSFAGSPRPRPDASLCPRELATEQQQVTKWLRTAIRSGWTGAPWEGRSPSFPRYVWYRHGGTVFEGRLVNRGLGEYKGYPLERSQWLLIFRSTDGRS